ncbi:hypothetical protein WBG78_16640 [Chryseolinea sp. T2]|uniref:hypothetical protein n=1 Tax=Chryseolinea sp. T2 TaxID=3129255 RepID=UPI003077C794
MARPFFALISLCLLFSACTQRTICPAFQSAYIYDKEALRKKFSYFLEDSTPKILTASKNRYLVAEPVSYRKKLRSMNTVVMKDVNPVLPDSMKVTEEGLLGEDGATGEDGVVPGAELDLAARSVIDSTYIVDVPQDEGDTTDADEGIYMISKDKEVRMLKYHTPDTARLDPATGKYVAKTPKYEVADIRFNVEQDNYMWYLRKSLVLPDVRLAQNMQAQQNEEAKKEKKGLKGFFQNLFKRKKKDAPDSLETAPKPVEEFDYVDENEVETPTAKPAEQPAKKKGLFGKKKAAEAEPARDIPATSGGRTEESGKKKEKKKKEKKSKDSKPKDDAAPKEEEDDDGF